MKLITLNTWGGRIKGPLEEFLIKNQDVDIFCFQEVFHSADGKDNIWTDGTNLDLLKDLERLLPQYATFFHPHLGDFWGLALFVNKKFAVKDFGEEFVYRMRGYDLQKEMLGNTAKNIQYAVLEEGGKEFVIVNFHGLWNGQGKSDTTDRIAQSENIVTFLNKSKKSFVLCGDFNLSPDTESIKLLESKLSVRNLIKEYGVISTRTSHYKKENRFADYIFTSSDIEVQDFKVLPEEVSDHSALLLEFNLK